MAKKINNVKPQAPAAQTREQQIDARQIAVMQRQIADLVTTLARAEAVRDQIISENNSLFAELEALRKGKK